MSYPLPPSFPVEKQKERLKALQEENKLKSELNKTFEVCFSKGNLDYAMSMLGRGKKILWRPNNYRLKIPFKKGSIRNFGSMYPSLGSFPLEVKKKGMSVLKVNPRITLLIQTNSVTGIFSLKNLEGGKEWYEVKTLEIGAFTEWLGAKVKHIENQLKAEAVKLGLPLDLEASTWIRHEDGVKNEEFLSSLPPELVLHDTYFKKVYKDEVEFKSPEYVKNYITNRAIEQVSPEISRELAEIKSLLQPSPPPVVSRVGSVLDFSNCSSEAEVLKILRR